VQYRTSFDFRATDGTPGLEGHAATWWSKDSYDTAMEPGAFKRTIRNRIDKIPVLWNHNADAPVGKHLAIREDDHGLYVNIGIADDGAEGSVLMKRLRFGVPLGMSFGFETMKDRPGTKDDPIVFGDSKMKHSDVRVIQEVRYWESSPVTFPANEDSAIDAIRSAHMEQQADYLTTILEALRSGDVARDDARMPLLRQIVAAIPDSNDPDSDPIEDTTPLVDSERARQRNRTVEITLALAKSKGWIGVLA
jgi:hypothetical protein